MKEKVFLVFLFHVIASLYSLPDLPQIQVYNFCVILTLA